MEDHLEPDFLTLRQAETLQQLLPRGTPISHLSRREAAGLIKLHSPSATWRQAPMTDRQKEFLRLRGLWREGLTRGEASALIGEAMRRERPHSNRQ